MDSNAVMPAAGSIPLDVRVCGVLGFGRATRIGRLATTALAQGDYDDVGNGLPHFLGIERNRSSWP